MTLPYGWTVHPVGDLGEVVLGRQRAPKYHHGDSLRRYLRVANVFEDRIDASDVMEMQFSNEEFERYRLRDGDVLLNEGQSPELLGRPAIYRGVPPAVAFTNTLIRFRPGPRVTSEWALTVFRHYMRSQRFMREGRITTNIAHLSAARFKHIEFPVPPLAEQARITANVDEAMSQVDVGELGLIRAASQLAKLRLAAVHAALHGTMADCSVDGRAFPGHWQLLTPRAIAAAVPNAIAIGPFGSNLTVFDYRESGVPLVFVRNVRSGVFRDKTTRHVDSEKASILRSHAVRPGDVLITKMGDPPGDSAVYPVDQQDGIITADVIKLTPGAGINPYYLSLAMTSPFVRRQVGAISRGVAQLKMSLGRFTDQIQIPIPPASEQVGIVATVDAWTTCADNLVRSLDVERKRAASLKSAILAAAVSGRLGMHVGAAETADNQRSTTGKFCGAMDVGVSE